jgi:hypothetical protein
VSDVDGEHCMDCGRAYGYVWTAPHKQWREVFGDEGGLLCVDCYDAKLRDRGTFVRWVPVPLDMWIETHPAPTHLRRTSRTGAVR